MANFRLGKHGSILADTERYRDLCGWHFTPILWPYLVSAVVARQDQGEAAARSVVEEPLKQCDAGVWPYPIRRYVHGDLSAEELLSQAPDKGRQTESRAYIGLYLSAAGKREEALPYLRWVDEQGEKAFYEYTLARSELERLGGK